MKNNQLVFLDMLIGFVLLPTCIFIRFVRRGLGKFLPVRFEGVLVIKFLGAGNFLAIKDTIDGRDVDVVTASSNAGVLKSFSIGKKAYIIDDSSLFRLCLSASVCCFKLFFRHYHQVINLETESKFAKFLTALTSAQVLSGITNVHKSYIDLWLYDRYLVNPLMLNKATLIAQLEGFHASPNQYIQSSISKHCEQFNRSLLKAVSSITISPTCSNTDQMRRLSEQGWISVLDALHSVKGVEHIDAVFSSQTDPQYQLFKELQARFLLLDVKVTSYQEFVEQIKFTDLLITVDSQALHLRQQFGAAAVAIYGPTSPFGINLNLTTYPITRSLVCSPCTHKYLKLPCHGKAPCMDFDMDAFDILLEINQ